MAPRSLLTQGVVFRAVSVLGALALALGLLALPADAQDDGVTPARVAGENRVATAASIATLTYDRADVAHLVSGAHFPDALAASYAAGAVDGPILLPASADDVGATTLDALEELDVQEVRLVGGSAVLDPVLETQLVEHGYDTARIAGPNRFATAAEVARTYTSRDNPIGTVDGRRTAILASADNYPDALAAGPIAAAARLPLILTSRIDRQPEVDAVLRDLGIEHLIVPGGTAAVSTLVEDHYRSLGYTTERIAGADRTATAALLADAAVQRFGFSYDTVLLARGDGFADALTASAHAAARGAPIALTYTPHRLSPHTMGMLARACPEVTAVRALGGGAAVAPGTLDAAVTSAEACREGPQTGEPSMDERSSPGFPEEGDLTELTEVRTGAHDGFDRVTFEFAGGERPGWEATWVDQPRQAGSGHPVDVEGEAYLQVSSTAVARWGDGDYRGPDRIPVDGNVVTEVVMTGDFEAHLTWVIGLERAVPFSTALVDDPVRLVIDLVER